MGGSNDNLELFLLFSPGCMMEASSTLRRVGKVLACGQADTISGLFKRGGCGGSSKSSATA